MSANGSVVTQVPDKDKPTEKATKKRPKVSEKAFKPPAEENSDDGSDEEESTGEGFFEAVTKFSSLKPGRYYRIVRLTNYRNHRVVAVPVKSVEIPFKTPNNIVQQ